MKENTDISDRVAQLIAHINLNPNSFAKSLGYHRSQTIYDIVKGKAKPSFDFFTRLFNSEYADNINMNWLMTGHGNIRKYPEASILNVEDSGTAYNHSNSIPLLSIEALSKYGKGEINTEELNCDRYTVPVFRQADYLVKVTEDTMLPIYQPEDLLACKIVSFENTAPQWSRIYVLNTARGPMIKRVHRLQDAKRVLLSSENKAYPPIGLNLNQINAIGLVIGSIRLA